VKRFRLDADRIVVELDAAESEIMARLAVLLDGQAADSRSPTVTSVDSPLYPEDGAASREFARFAAKERSQSRASDREQFSRKLEELGSGSIVLGDVEAAAWARVLAEARVSLAERHGLLEQGLPEDGTITADTALIVLLGHVQSDLVSVMLEKMEKSHE
jgi:hypothetical protein